MIYSRLLLKKPWCLSKWPAVKWLKYCQYGMKQINQSKWLYNVSKWLTKSLFLGCILYLHWESLWQGSLPSLHTLTGGFSPLSTYPDRRVPSPFYVPWQGSLPFLHTLTGFSPLSTYPDRKCGGWQQWCHAGDQILHLSLDADQRGNHLHKVLQKTNKMSENTGTRSSRLK